MEISKEIYGWLTKINAIDINISIKEIQGSNIILPENISKSIQNGYTFKAILAKIEALYNNFYKMKLSYSHTLNTLQDNNSPEHLDKNWSLISDFLINFGIEIKEDIDEIKSSNSKKIHSLIKNLSYLANELEGKSIEIKQFSTPEKTKLKDNSVSPKSPYQPKVSVSPKIEKDSIDIANINIEKDLNSCNSVIEFFIISLAKSLDFKPRQAAALLSNNRKYLIQIANKGIKSDYTKIINWFESLQIHQGHLLNLIEMIKGTAKIAFSLISVGLLSKNIHIALLAYNLMNNLKTSSDSELVNWMIKEGIDSFVFCFSKHELLRPRLFGIIADLVKDSLYDLLFELKSRISVKNFQEFIENCLIVINDINDAHKNEFKRFLVEFLDINVNLEDVKDEKMTKRNICLIVDFWIAFNPLQEYQSQSILKILKSDIRDKFSKINQKIAVIEFFRLLRSFALIKDKFAPIIYKILVFLFLEYYENCSLRELFLSNFGKLYQEDQTIPVMILLDPYLRQLKNSVDYTFLEVEFIIKIIEHPKFESTYHKDVYEFLCFLNLSNLFYNRITSLKIVSMLSRGYIDYAIIDFIINFVNNSIRLFNDTKEPIFLETPFLIARLKLKKINNFIEEAICDSVLKFRDSQKFVNKGLLTLLWCFHSYDDIMMIIEEKYSEKYKPSWNNQVKTKVVSSNLKENSRIRSASKIKDQNYKLKEESKNIIIPEKSVKKSKISHNESRNEASVINNSKNDISLINRSHIQILKENSPVQNSNYNVFITLDEEEPREKSCVNILIEKNKKYLVNAFNNYLEGKEVKIKKIHYLTFLKELGIILLNDEIFTQAMKNLFSVPLNSFDFNQFIMISHHLAYQVFSQKNSDLCYFECFAEFCKNLKKAFSNKNENILHYKIKQRLKSNPKALVPPGFIKLNSQEVKLNYKIPKTMKKFFTEPQMIVLDILDEIFVKILNSHILESFAENYTKIDLVQVQKRPKWEINTFIAYTYLDPLEIDKGNINEIVDLCDVMLNNLEQGKNFLKKEKHIHPKDAEEIKMIEDQKKENERIEKKRKIRMLEIKKEIEEMKIKKEEEQKQKEIEQARMKQEEDEKNKANILKENENRKKIKEEIIKNKIFKEEFEKIKQEDQKKKIEEISREKEKERQEFLKIQEKKLKDQFRVLLEEKKKAQAHEPVVLPEINIKKIFEKDKEYVDFEKNIYKNIQIINSRSEISEILKKYENHLQTIFEIYSKFGQSKLSFSLDIGIFFNQFREFCLDFNILGFVITTEQVAYIFNKISRYTEDNKEDTKQLKFNDFLVCFTLLCLFAKYTNKSIKLSPNDAFSLNSYSLKEFIDFIGLKQPFQKKQIEDYINARKHMSVKQELELKKNLLNEVKNLKEKGNEKIQLKGNRVNSRKELPKLKENIQIRNMNMMSPVGRNEILKIKKNMSMNKIKTDSKNQLKRPNSKTSKPNNLIDFTSKEKSEEIKVDKNLDSKLETNENKQNDFLTESNQPADYHQINQIKAVDILELEDGNKQEYKQMNVIGPEGNIENWEIENQENDQK